jgi:uncharacterized lipoprotein YbaY
MEERKKLSLRVGGRIVIAEKTPAFRNGTVHVYLEEVSRADAESVTVAETVIEDVGHGGRDTEIPFCLGISDRNSINPKNSYSVRVWIDTDGEPSAEDLFTDRAYGVLTRGFGDFVEVKIGF